MFQNLEPVHAQLDFGGDMRFTGDIARAVAIDTNDLLTEAATNAGKIVFWGSMAAEATFAVAAAKQEVKTIRGSRGEIIREGLINSGEKATVQAVENRVETDAQVVDAEARLARIIVDADKCKAVYEAAKQRGALILALSRIVQSDGGDDLRDHDRPATAETPPAARRRRTGQ